jgi:Fe-S cluster assembly protein SufD
MTAATQTRRPADDARARYRAAFASIAPSLPGAALPWLREARRAALRRFDALGFPDARQEDWKYTRVGAIEKRDFKPASVSRDVTTDDIERFALADTRRLVFVDGRYTPEFSDVDGWPAGARIANLAATLYDHPHALESWLGSEAPASQNGFEALNAAFWADGVYIELATGTVIEKPIHLLFVTSQANVATHPYTIIRAGEGSRTSIVEHHVSIGEHASLTNASTRIVAGPGARIEHCKLQEQSRQSFHIGGVQVRQHEKSRFTSCSFALGAALSRNEIATRFEGPGCEATLSGLYMVEGRQHVDHHTSIDHAREEGTSREWYKGVLDGEARAVFNGKVIVRPDAQKSDAHQSNRNLLLSAGAEVDTKPQLEIFADDVKCTHGATVGALDEDQIFYLRSRGLDETAARKALTIAFADDIVERCGIAPLRERVRALLSERLGGEAKS